jgi:hypothetical protein
MVSDTETCSHCDLPEKNYGKGELTGTFHGKDITHFFFVYGKNMNMMQERKWDTYERH